MNAVFQFEARRIAGSWLAYGVAALLVWAGIFCGSQFNLSIGEGIYMNSPYTTGFMVGMLSLSVVFFAIPAASRLLFAESDAKFDHILFALPVSKAQYLGGKFSVFFLQVFLSFLLLIIGFSIGRGMRGESTQVPFSPWYFIYPLLVFGFLNCLFVCSVLFVLSFTIRRKLVVVAGGLLLYILYMIVMVFSNSPFMSASLPQSLEAQHMSALLDPFGLSAYFLQSTILSAAQKNSQVVSFSGWLLLNRVVFMLIPGALLLITYRCFSFSIAARKNAGGATRPRPEPNTSHARYTNALPRFDGYANLKSIFSLARIDLIYLFKGITMVAVSMLLLFAIGMEMYAEIEKGIRLPQKYASSGLMAVTISENFHFLGLLIVTYFVNDIYWRSAVSGFSQIEESTFFSKNKLAGHMVSITVLLFFFIALLIGEGLVFQYFYHYRYIDWHAYGGVILFTTSTAVLFSLLVLLINDCSRNRFVALGASLIVLLVLASPFSRKLLPNPLFQVFSGYNGSYSDFNGYGSYAAAFAWRLLFGFGAITLIVQITESIRAGRLRFAGIVVLVSASLCGGSASKAFMEGYIPTSEALAIEKSVQYERAFRRFESLPQPTVTDVITTIDLLPAKQAYQLKGRYILKNLSSQRIDKLLIRFHPDLTLVSALLETPAGTSIVRDEPGIVHLNQPLAPNDTATLDFTLFYQWHAVNGHQPLNAIIGNGSFMRISRYYPAIGYQKSLEVQDEQVRKKYSLGMATALRKAEAPGLFKRDFVNLDMVVSTDKDQTAIGTGDLSAQWTKDGRNYFRYKAGSIPFRFAVSSARYQRKTALYKGIGINVYYHPSHRENVDHLLDNARLTLDYCITHFGPYPFNSISFAEISSSTKGFAATAYPSAVFMPEDMVFHANIHADKQQDVINELAGHELSHLWWGNSQVNPDDREGALMLTETLAMYTEMMLYKKMHGKAKMMDRVNMHRQIYDQEKGLYAPQPLFKVTSESTHIAYSKGAVAMVALSELLGEQRVNAALRSFLLNNRYPKKPASTDLLTEFYKISPDSATSKEIDSLFKEE